MNCLKISHGPAFLVTMVATALWVLPAHAIVHDEVITRSSPVDGMSGNVAGGVETASGNNHFNAARGAIAVQYQTSEEAGDDEVLGRQFGAKISYTYRSLEWDDPFSNDAFLYFRYTHDLTSNLALNAFAQAEYNRFTGTNLRAIAGLGPQWLSVLGPHFRVTAITAYMPEYEIVPKTGTVNTGTRIFRGKGTLNHRWNSSLTLSFQALERGVIIKNTSYVQPRFDDFEDFRALNALDVSFLLNPYVNWTLSWQVHYDSEPPEGIRKTDRRLQSTLSYSF